MDSLKEYFRPELLNRVDSIVVFNYLGKPEIKKIVNLELDKVKKRIEKKKMKIERQPNIHTMDVLLSQQM